MEAKLDVYWTLEQLGEQNYFEAMFNCDEKKNPLGLLFMWTVTNILSNIFLSRKYPKTINYGILRCTVS